MMYACLIFDFLFVLLHTQVQVEVESTDRVGNMLGWLFLSDGTNLAEKLVRNGLATVHGSAERSRYATALYKAEEEAKAARRNVSGLIVL
jgi:staphylococcal nuclease domain-containing protein 1